MAANSWGMAAMTLATDSLLAQAITFADLPGLLATYLTGSGAQPGRAGRVLCVWRDGKDRNGSLYRGRDGRWRLHDHVLNQTFDAYSFLVDIVGFSPRDAAKQLLRDAGLDGAPRTFRPRPPRAPDVWDSNPADLPDELLASTWAHGQVKLEPFDPFTLEGYKNLEMLSGWMANSLRPVIAPHATTPRRAGH
jgi:hypothetical protein